MFIIEVRDRLLGWIQFVGAVPYTVYDPAQATPMTIADIGRFIAIQDRFCKTFDYPLSRYIILPAKGVLQ